MADCPSSSSYGGLQGNCGCGVELASASGDWAVCLALGYFRVIWTEETLLHDLVNDERTQTGF